MCTSSLLIPPDKTCYNRVGEVNSVVNSLTVPALKLEHVFSLRS